MTRRVGVEEEFLIVDPAAGHPVALVTGPVCGQPPEHGTGTALLDNQTL